MKPSDRVNRIQDQQPTAATVLEVRWETVLIEYDEGGQGWWPINCLEIIDNTDWFTFKKALILNTSDPNSTAIAVNSSLLTALPQTPAAVLNMPMALAKAEQGDLREFITCWAAVQAVSPLPPSVLSELHALAVTCNLPENLKDFLASL